MTCKWTEDDCRYNVHHKEVHESWYKSDPPKHVGLPLHEHRISHLVVEYGNTSIENTGFVSLVPQWNYDSIFSLFYNNNCVHKIRDASLDMYNELLM